MLLAHNYKVLRGPTSPPIVFKFLNFVQLHLRQILRQVRIRRRKNLPFTNAEFDRPLDTINKLSILRVVGPGGLNPCLPQG